MQTSHKAESKKHLSNENTSGGSGADTIFYSLDCAVIKVFWYSFWETIPMFFNHLKSDFILVQLLQSFTPVIDYELKFVKMQFLIESISLWQQ